MARGPIREETARPTLAWPPLRRSRRPQVFLLELALNMAAHWFWPFFRSWAHVFDFIVIIVSLVSLLDSSFPGMSALRVLRTFRVFRLFARLRSLRTVIRSLSASLIPVLSAFFVVFTFTAVYSILGVQVQYASLLQPSERCNSVQVVRIVRGRISALYQPYLPQYFRDFAQSFFTVMAVLLDHFVCATAREKHKQLIQGEAKRLMRRGISNFEIQNPLGPLLEDLCRFSDQEDMSNRISSLFYILDHEVRGFLSFEEMKDGLARMFMPPMHLSFDDWERMTRGMELCNELEQVDEKIFHIIIRNEIRTYIEASISKGMKVTSRGSFENAAISALRVLLLRLDPPDLPVCGQFPSESKAPSLSGQLPSRSGSVVCVNQGLNGGSHDSAESIKRAASQDQLQHSPVTWMTKRIDRAAARLDRFSSLPSRTKMANGTCVHAETLEDDYSHKPHMTEKLQSRSMVMKQLLLVLNDNLRQRQQLLEDNNVFREIQNILLSAGNCCGAIANTHCLSRKESLRQSHGDNLILTVNVDLHGTRSFPESRSESASPARRERLNSTDGSKDDLEDGETMSSKSSIVFAKCFSWKEICKENAYSSEPSILAALCSSVCVQLIFSVQYSTRNALEIQVLKILQDSFCCPRYEQVLALNLPKGSPSLKMAIGDEVEAQGVVLVFSDSDDNGPLLFSGDQLAELLLSRLTDDRVKSQVPWCNIMECFPATKFCGADLRIETSAIEL